MVEVEGQERSAEGIKTLPVNVLRVRDHPRLEHSLELGVSGGRREQLMILVTSWYVHLDLSVCGDGGFFVYVAVGAFDVSL